MLVSVAPLIACPPSRLPMAQCPWPNANAAPLRRWHVKDGRHEAPFPIPIPSHSALPLLILSLLRGPAITITIAIAIPLYTHTHTHTHTTPHPHPLPHPSISFLFAPAAAAVRFSLPTSTNHSSPMLPAVPLNRRDGVRLLSSVVPWSSAPHTALYAQLTNPRPQSIPRFLNSSIPQSPPRDLYARHLCIRHPHVHPHLLIGQRWQMTLAYATLRDPAAGHALSRPGCP
jgi:hypothetical protein